MKNLVKKSSSEKPLDAHSRIWTSKSLKDFIFEIIKDDLFVGLAKYITTIDFYWSREIPTACAGHGFIFYNPDFFASIPEQSRKTIVAHEIWHLILKHLERGKDYDPYYYNVAADYIINNNLEEEGFSFKDTGGLLNPKYKYFSTEEVYEEIFKDNKQKIDISNHVSKETIEDLIKESLKDKNITYDKQKKIIQNNIEEVRNAIKRECVGNTIFLKNSREKVLIIEATYDNIFKKYLIDPLSGGKRTFVRPNRRQHGNLQSKLKLPGKFPKRGHLNRLTHLVYALDVSGSISQKQAQQFHDSVRTIKEMLNPEKLTVLFFDTKIVLEKTFTEYEKYKEIKVEAGGGTNLNDVYKRTKELNPEALVVFTDLCVTIPKKENWDSIWIVPSKDDVIPSNIYGKVYLIPDHK